jgi:NAD(P)-dependent dehydrogenase (short-subunit alcohol dehydrogenase family)
LTGAASGIGAAVAAELARCGATVIGLDRQGNLDADVAIVHCDVTETDDVALAIGSILNWHGRVDVLVNAAGIHRPGTIAETEPGTWDEVLAVNLRGAYLVSRAVIRAMADGGGGSIVHVASVAGLIGGAGSAAYVASKGGLIALTKAMAADHAHERIRVNCVCPGMVVTPMLHASGADLDHHARERQRLERLAHHPIGRLGRPDDVAAATSTWLARVALGLRVPH